MLRRERERATPGRQRGDSGEERLLARSVGTLPSTPLSPQAAAEAEEKIIFPERDDGRGKKCRQDSLKVRS